MIKSGKTVESTSIPTELDSKDLSILKLLQQNARITVKEISENVHLSTTPVMRDTVSEMTSLSTRPSCSRVSLRQSSTIV